MPQSELMKIDSELVYTVTRNRCEIKFSSLYD